WTTGAYFMLLAKPVYTPVFPWIRMVFRYPYDNPIEHRFPPGYFVEPSVGVLWLAPWIIAALLVPGGAGLGAGRKVRGWLLMTGISAAAILLFLISTHLASHRYEVDFVPLAILTALVNICIFLRRSTGWRRAAMTGLICLLLSYSIVANLALGFT